MKRIIVLLLSAILLLGGCAQQAAPVLSVKTDYSKYVPAEHYNPAFGTVDVFELIPGEDYGTIYPFVGEYYDNLYVSLYGFLDESGEVIVAPVYPVVESKDSAQGGVWVLGNVDREDADDYSYAPYRYAIAARDGSKITDFLYSSVEVYDELVFAAEAVEAYDEYHNEAYVYRYDIYDLALNPVTSSEELLQFEPQLCQSLSEISYSEGMLRLVFGQEYSGDWPEEVYYIELETLRVLGPYNDGSDFVNGYAIVDTYDRRGRSYMDRQGSFIEGEFSASENFKNGIALVSNFETGRFSCDAVIDETGRMLLAAEYGESISIEDHWIAFSWDWELDLTAYYTLEGELLYPGFYPYEDSKEYAGHFPASWSHLGDGFFYLPTEGQIINILDGTIPVEGIHDTNWGPVFRMEELPCYIVKFDGTEYENRVYNLRMEEIMTFSDGVVWEEYTDPFTGERYLCLEPYDTGTLRIFDKDMTLCFEMPWDYYEYTYAIYNGRILYQNELGCRYFDMEGNTVFDYPFVSNDG